MWGQKRNFIPWPYREGLRLDEAMHPLTIMATGIYGKDIPNRNMIQPSEYGFYSNVNPEVDHPRWSQASERQIGGGLLAKRVPTLKFNGYEEEVAGLYEGMDLRANF